MDNQGAKVFENEICPALDLGEQTAVKSPRLTDEIILVFLLGKHMEDILFFASNKYLTNLEIWTTYAKTDIGFKTLGNVKTTRKRIYFIVRFDGRDIAQEIMWVERSVYLDWMVCSVPWMESSSLQGDFQSCSDTSRTLWKILK